MLRNDYLDAPTATSYIAQQHIERYRFAAHQLKPGMSVLDIASGTGYGSAILQQAGCDVIAADLGRDQLLQARSAHGIQRLVWANALYLPFRADQLDAVVTFETIEHVVEGRAFLEEMRRVLKPGGVFICSTPNILYTAHPPYHLKEYTIDEFFALVQQVFPGAARYAQYFTQADYEADALHRQLNRFKRLIRVSPLALIFRPLYRMFKHRTQARRIQVSGGSYRVPQAESPYRVRSWEPDTHWVRIMVAVAAKEDQNADWHLRAT